MQTAHFRNNNTKNYIAVDNTNNRATTFTLYKQTFVLKTTHETNNNLSN